MVTKPTKAQLKREQLRATRERLLSEQFPGVHPNALKFVRPGAKYVSRGRREFEILQAPGGGLWRIHQRYGGGRPKAVQSEYTRFSDAEQALILYLKSTDKFNKAIYPGSHDGTGSN